MGQVAPSAFRRGSDFLAGGGETGALLRAIDWRATELGPPENWPESLKLVVRLMLTASHPVCIFWGSGRLCFYNDAYGAALGPEHHPRLLCGRGPDLPPEIWSVLGPRIDEILAGIEGAPVLQGSTAGVQWTYSCSAIPDDGAPHGVGGAFVIAAEATDMAALARQGAFVIELGDRLRALADPAEIARLSAQWIGEELKASRVVFAELGVGETSADVFAEWTDGTVSSFLGERALAAFGPELAAAFVAGETVVMEDVRTDPRADARAAAAYYDSIGVCSGVAVPLMRDGRVDGILALSASSPRKWSKLETDFLKIVASRIFTSIKRARAEADAAAREALLRTVTDAVPALISYVGPDLRYRFVNAAYSDWFGIPKEDVKGRHLSEILGDKAFASIRPYAERALGGEALSYETLLEYRRGGARHVAVQYAPYRNDDGSVAGFVALVADISARKRAEIALAESEARFREVADSTPTPVWMTDRDGKMVFSNAQFAENTGKTADEIRGDGWKNLIHPDDQAAVAKAREKAWSQGRVAYSYGARFRRRDGAWRSMEVTSRPRINKEGVFEGYIGMAVDRTDAILAQEALAESEARFRDMADNAPVMVWVTDPEGGRVWTSRTWYEFTGQTEEEAQGAGWLDAAHPEDRAEAERLFLDANARKAPFRVEYRLRRRDGAHRWMIDSARPRFGAGGEFLGCVGSVVDIDDLKKAEERNQLLVDELNHRVKNTLAIVQSLAVQTFRDVPDCEAPRSAFEGRLASLAEAHNLLTEEAWERAELGALAGAVLAPASARRARIKAHGLKVRLPPKKAVTIAMALHELLTNALKYGALSTEDGKVFLSWTNDRTNGFRLVWREEGGPPVTRPARRGFGARMIEDALAADLGGAVTIDYAAAGVVCTITAPAFD